MALPDSASLDGTLEGGLVQNGVLLKLISSGVYTWSIMIAADSNSIEDLEIAAEKAVSIDASLKDALPHAEPWKK
jgi:hypothetical protein